MSAVRCLVTGASGYVGGRLVPLLLAHGYQVRCLVRSARRLRDVAWAGQVEIVEGDVTDRRSLIDAFDGTDIVYYLVHALGRADFEDVDRAAAGNVAAAARDGGAGRIVYLGGPAPDGPDAGVSAHLRSRAEVGDILLASGVPTVVLRAGVVLGSGSASFEMLRYLTERLPVMVTPRWVRNSVQPIAIGDVLRYLVACADRAMLRRQELRLGHSGLQSDPLAQLGGERLRRLPLAGVELEGVGVVLRSRWLVRRRLAGEPEPQVAAYPPGRELDRGDRRQRDHAGAADLLMSRVDQLANVRMTRSASRTATPSGPRSSIRSGGTPNPAATLRTRQAWAHAASQ